VLLLSDGAGSSLIEISMFTFCVYRRARAYAWLRNCSPVQAPFISRGKFKKKKKNLINTKLHMDFI